MYLLIIIIHAVFILLCHLLGYTVFEGIFMVLGLFFLFYFSPLFFIDSEKKEYSVGNLTNIRDAMKQLSPKDSLLLPVFLLYIALYGFIFSIFGTHYSFIFLHAGMIIFIFLIFLGYSLSFFWKHDIFFELFRFHSIFTLISSILCAFGVAFNIINNTSILPVLSVLGVGSGIFLLTYTKKENFIFLSSFLTGLYSSLYLILITIHPDLGLFILLFFGIILSLMIFEICPNISICIPYISFFQYFSLISLLIFLPILLYFAFTALEFIVIALLILIIIFFLSIHIRYINYVTFVISILLMYCVYGLLFSNLLLEPSIFSTFLYIYFLPILLIGTTYFWEEQHPYDFLILHYSSIGFGVIFSFYSIFFLPWGSDILFVTSLSIFGIAILLFLSYFRFRNLHTH